jgi:CSLREA domain-containing protein
MTLLVTTTADELNPDDNQLSLREAINQAQPGDTIELPAGTYAITRANGGYGQSEDANLSGDFDITKSVTIEGAGAAATVITSALGDTSPDRIFDVLGAITVEFRDVTISGGRTISYDTSYGHSGWGSGGGIRAASGGIVKLTNSIVENCSSVNLGGGIFVATPSGASGGSGALILENSIVRDNHAVPSESYGAGGGIAAVGSDVTITDSTISGNTAGGDGGGIAFAGSSLSITGSTISGNTAKQDGGGLYGADAGAYGDGASSVTMTLTDSTVSGNTASGESSGGGIYASETASLSLTNVTMTANTAFYGGGIYNNGTASLLNTIVAGNTGPEVGPDVDGAFTSTKRFFGY